MYLQGFARHPGLVKPHWYIGSLQATQGEALKASLVTAGVPAENITWVEGVTPAAIERGNWSSRGWRDQDRAARRCHPAQQCDDRLLFDRDGVVLPDV